MKKIIKIVTIILLIAMLLQHSIVFANVVKAGETKYIERGDLGFYSIQYWNETYNNWYYVTYSRTYYTDDNGDKRIAYCNSPDYNGVGWIPDEFEGYNTIVQGKISDDKLWRVFKNGYPYVSPESLGVETEDDAYLATKQAAYFIIKGRSESEVYEYFRPGEDPINDQNIQETQRRGKKVIDAIYNLVSNAYNSFETINDINIERVGNITIDDNNKDFSYQKYKISTNNNDESIEIVNLLNAPVDSYITNLDGEPQNIFKGGDSFKIVIPNKRVDKDYDIKIEYKEKAKTYPVFYAKSTIEHTQDYLLSVEKYDEEIKDLSLHINAQNAQLEIVKIDEQTKKSIPGVTFNIKYKNGQNIGNYKTDKQGKIVLSDLLPGKIILTEVETPEEYILNSTPREYTICYNQTLFVEIDNKEADPHIEINKEGPEKAKAGEEIKYEFNISNKGNVGLENFIWYDFLPYEKTKITKISTGTFNQSLEYNVYYRTDKNNEYILLKEKLSTNSNSFIDLSNINIDSEENIIEIKFEFGNVDIDFKSKESPFFYLKINHDVEDESTIINKTKIQGNYRHSSLICEDSVKTIVENKKNEVSYTLPRTGF